MCIDLKERASGQLRPKHRIVPGHQGGEDRCPHAYSIVRALGVRLWHILVLLPNLIRLKCHQGAEKCGRRTERNIISNFVKHQLGFAPVLSRDSGDRPKDIVGGIVELGLLRRYDAFNDALDTLTQ